MTFPVKVSVLTSCVSVFLVVSVEASSPCSVRIMTLQLSPNRNLAQCGHVKRVTRCEPGATTKRVLSVTVGCLLAWQSPSKSYPLSMHCEARVDNNSLI